MAIRGTPLRAVLLPITVAIVLVAALLFYKLLWIPGQQQYLHERNDRILQTIARQIASKVDQYDQSIDNAMDSFGWDEGDDVKKKDVKKKLDQKRLDPLVASFREYVLAFTGDLDVTLGVPQGSSDDRQVVRKFGDPPRVRIHRDEGRNFLYIGYGHQHAERNGEPDIEARSDIEQAVMPYLQSRTEFEALLLADRDGRVIAQYSPGGLRLEHVDGLDFYPAAASSPQAQKVTFSAVRNTGQVAKVVIGDVEYKFYAQPITLSLNSDLDDLTKQPPEGAVKPREQVEEWTLCGLVRADRFGAESVAISPIYWLLFIEALMLLCLSVPILKVHVLKPHERFQRSDAAWVFATTFLMAGLISVGVLDLYYFAYRFNGQTDWQFQRLAGALSTNLVDEVGEIGGRLDSFVPKTWLNGKSKENEKKDDESEDPIRPHWDWDPNLRRPSCHPSVACETNLLKADLPETGTPSAPRHYANFDLVVWNDDKGNQLVKWIATPSKYTPFINLRTAGVPYFDALERANQLGDLHRTGISVARSPNTGNSLTVFWKALGTELGPRLSGGQLVLAAPISVSRPVLPRHVQFAVLDAAGQVVYHSEPSRSLNENFFTESEDNARLKAAIRGRQSLALTSQYLGSKQRLFVTPVDFSRLKNFEDPGWSVAIFQPVDVPDTVNLETLVVAGGMLGIYYLLLAAAWCLAVVVAPQAVKKSFWPDHEKAAAYRTVAWLNLGLTLAFLALALIAQRSPAVIVAALVIAIVGMAATVTLVLRPAQGDAKSTTWERDFFLALLSFLFVASAVPAMACFQAALNFEGNVLARRGAIDLVAKLDERRDRIRADVAKLGLCDAKDPCTFLQNRLDERKDQPAFFPPPSSAEADDASVFASEVQESARNTLAPEAGWFARSLAFMHFPINDEAKDLRVALPGAGRSGLKWQRLEAGADDVSLSMSAGRDRNVVVTPPPEGIRTIDRGWLVSIAATLGLAVAALTGIALFLYFGVMPMFLLDLYVRPVFELRPAPVDGNLLVVGLPGVQKSSRMQSEHVARVIDVRTGALALTADDAPGLVIVEHVDHQFDVAAVREPLLTFLERLTYGGRRVWIATTREPLDHLRELSAPDLDRWSSLFRSFRKERIGLIPLVEDCRPPRCADLLSLILSECSMSQQLLTIGNHVLGEATHTPLTPRSSEAVLTEIGIAAEPYYHALWATCSRDEKLALQQLADEGMVNPQNGAVVARLLRSGLVRRDPAFRVMNETFRRFVLQMVSAGDLKVWEREGVDMPWSSYALSAATVAAGLAGVLILTQMQLLDAWIGYAPAVVPAAATLGNLGKLIAGAQPAKSGTGNA